MIWWFWDREDKYIKKRKQGIVFYSKSSNDNDVEYKKPNSNRRITCMRIFTHTRK